MKVQWQVSGYSMRSAMAPTGVKRCGFYSDSTPMTILRIAARFMMPTLRVRIG